MGEYTEKVTESGLKEFVSGDREAFDKAHALDPHNHTTNEVLQAEQVYHNALLAYEANPTPETHAEKMRTMQICNDVRQAWRKSRENVQSSNEGPHAAVLGAMV